jgi:hypothetical protein
MRFPTASVSRISSSRIVATAAIFVSAVCLFLIASTAWSIWNARQVQLQELDTATGNMAYSLAQHADLVFKAADTALIGLDERIAIDGTSPKALARLEILLKSHLRELPQLKGQLIYDKDGLDAGWSIRRVYRITPATMQIVNISFITAIMPIQGRTSVCRSSAAQPAYGSFPCRVD